LFIAQRHFTGALASIRENTMRIILFIFLCFLKVQVGLAQTDYRIFPPETNYDSLSKYPFITYFARDENCSQTIYFRNDSTAYLSTNYKPLDHGATSTIEGKATIHGDTIRIQFEFIEPNFYKQLLNGKSSHVSKSNDIIEHSILYRDTILTVLKGDHFKFKIFKIHSIKLD
jgi:hypothetical protein